MKKIIPLLLIILIGIILIGCKEQGLKFDETKVFEAKVVSQNVVEVDTSLFGKDELVNLDTTIYKVDDFLYVKYFYKDYKVVKVEIIGIKEVKK